MTVCSGSAVGGCGDRHSPHTVQEDHHGLGWGGVYWGQQGGVVLVAVVLVVVRVVVFVFMFV